MAVSPGRSYLSDKSTDSFNSAAADPLAWAWPLLLAAVEHLRLGRGEDAGVFALASDGALRAGGGGAPAQLARHDGVWALLGAVPSNLQTLFDLYLPVCSASVAAPLTIGHLGQSLDGYIATGSGDSSYINGPENILHLHRMRALCDAIVVGAGTIEADDPRLTTRLATGASPVRVILDPRRRLSPQHRVFTDGEAMSVLVCDAELAAHAPKKVGQAEVLAIPCTDGRLDLSALLTVLRARGLYSIFVEGGGATVSSFLEAGLLDRIQIAIAPLIMGRGRPGLRLPASERIAECLRPAHRVFAMGADVLFDCNLRSSAAELESKSE